MKNIILFKNDTGSKLAINIDYWLRDGGHKTLAGISTGGKPAALKAIIEKYRKAGFMVEVSGWNEYRELIEKAARIDGKGSQAAEKLAIIKCYDVSDPMTDGYTYIIKDKKQEVKTMKKVSYEVVITAKNRGGKWFLETVQGYTRDDIAGFAVRKGKDGWTVDHIETGVSVISTGSATRDAAIEELLKVIDRARAILADEKRHAELMKVRRLAAGEVLEEKQPEQIKEVKAEPVKEETPEEVKEEVKTEAQDPEEIKADIMEEVKAGNLKVLLPMFMMNHKNASAIMAAGISADAFSVAEVLRFLETGKMPDFHTFNVWQKLGYTVRKGEKAAFMARIWKYTEKEETEETETDAQEVPENAPDYIRKTAFFFGPAQVDAKPYKELHAEGVKIEIRGRYEIATGKTKENKEALKAAGFTWNKKNAVWFRVKPETDGPEDPKGSPDPVREPETKEEQVQVIEESREPEKIEETAAKTLERVYAEARERIQAADLTEAQRERLLLDIRNCHILGSAAAYMLETVKNADGLVYDVKGKAVMIRGEVKSYGWRNEKTAHAEGEFWWAYVTEQYGRKTIRIYLKGDNKKELNILILPKEEPNKKPRIDAEQVAEGMKNAVIEQATRIENAGIFAGRVKDLEEKKKAVLAMIAEMKKESIADYDTVSAFGFKEGNYNTFEHARI